MLSRFIKIAPIMIMLLLLFSCLWHQNNDVKDKIDDNELVTERHSVLSPSGIYELRMIANTVNDVRGFSFEVLDASKEQRVFLSTDFYRLRDTTYLLWGEDDTVWVYSGDLGTFYWENNSGVWEKKEYSENKNNIDPPELLKLLRP